MIQWWLILTDQVSTASRNMGVAMVNGLPSWIREANNVEKDAEKDPAIWGMTVMMRVRCCWCTPGREDPLPGRRMDHRGLNTGVKTFKESVKSSPGTQSSTTRPTRSISLSHTLHLCLANSFHLSSSAHPDLSLSLSLSLFNITLNRNRFDWIWIQLNLFSSAESNFVCVFGWFSTWFESAEIWTDVVMSALNMPHHHLFTGYPFQGIWTRFDCFIVHSSLSF